MKVCVVGGGGREHALAEVLARHHDVVVTPGNPGIPGSVATPAEEVEADLYVIGPEAPLVDGLADRLRAEGRLVFGPGADGARLEGSKAWMKEVLVEAGVATAALRDLRRRGAALAFLDTMRPPYVVKTDGLAAGKGVLVTNVARRGPDGRRRVPLGRGVRRRRAHGGHRGGPDRPGDLRPRGVRRDRVPWPSLRPRTSSASATATPGRTPAGWAPTRRSRSAGPDLVDEVMRDAVEPTLAALRRRGIDYRGVLYAGLMLTPDGPKVLEYNVRFGDPETQVVVPRLTSDLGELLASAARGHIDSAPAFDDGAAVTVVCAAEGYPRSVRTGDPIRGIDDAASLEGVSVFCAGVARGAEGGLVTAGGRVLAVTGRAASIAEARALAYRGAGLISWTGRQLRGDIAAG